MLHTWQLFRLNNCFFECMQTEIASEMIDGGVASRGQVDHQGSTLSVHEQVLSTPEDIFRKTLDLETREVRIESDVTLADYEAITPWDDLNGVIALGESLKGKRISWVNATAAGGGVAIMRPPQIHLMRLLGVDARWYVTEPDEDAHKVTKKIHNILQNVASSDSRVTDTDWEVYDRWTERNSDVLVSSLASSDVVVCDDPQPSGLIPKLLEANPDIKIIFRDHIQSEGELMSTPGTPQHDVWDRIWNTNRVRDAHLHVFHPVEAFVPENVPDETIAFMPATTDLLDGLNRPLSLEEIDEGIAFFNERLHLNGEQLPLDPDRPRIIQIARFDPSKGIPWVLEAYAKFRSYLEDQGIPPEQTPQLIITGNGSIDDPDGEPILAETMRLRSEKYEHLADDIKVARVPHNDKALNALLRTSWVALQLSRKEGLEVKVSECQIMGVPVIASRAGGIPLQIVDGETGYLVAPGDTDAVADHLELLFLNRQTDVEMNRRIASIARTHNYEFTTVPNVLNWLYVSRELLENSNFSANRRLVRDMVRESTHGHEYDIWSERNSTSLFV